MNLIIRLLRLLKHKLDKKVQEHQDAMSMVMMTTRTRIIITLHCKKHKTDLAFIQLTPKQVYGLADALMKGAAQVAASTDRPDEVQ